MRHLNRQGNAPARFVGFSNMIPTSVESQRQWLQYKKKSGSPSVFADDIRPSADSGDQTVRRSTCSCTTGTENSSAHTYTKKVRKSEDLGATTYLLFSPRTSHSELQTNSLDSGTRRLATHLLHRIESHSSQKYRPWVSWYGCEDDGSSGGGGSEVGFRHGQ
jgi:hypothetical protein